MAHLLLEQVAKALGAVSGGFLSHPGESHPEWIHLNSQKTDTKGDPRVNADRDFRGYGPPPGQKRTH
jgi:hypothetical protein